MSNEIGLQLQDFPTDIGVDLDALTRSAVAGGIRQRRRRRLGAVAAGVAVIVAGVAVAVPVSGVLNAGRQQTSIGPASEPGEDAPYWHVVIATSGEPTEDVWEGHTEPSVDQLGDAPQHTERFPFLDSFFYLPGPILAGGTVGPSPDPGLTWDDMWALPRTADGLAGYIQKRESEPLAGGEPVADAIKEWAAGGVLREPGPAALHLAVVDLLSRQPGVTVTTGTDTLGRPARILTFAVPYAAEVPSGGGSPIELFTDPTSGAMLQLRQGAQTTTYTELGPVEDHLRH